MEPTGGDVEEFVAAVQPARRREDARVLIDLMREVSGHEPELWGTIIGFGRCHYRYPTGNEGDMGVLGFAPRKAASTIYLSDGVAAHADELAALGPHTSSVACVYIKRLEDVDLDVLRGILERSRDWVEGGGSEGMQITVTG
jgi:hypothetical protein